MHHQRRILKVVPLLFVCTLLFGSAAYVPGRVNPLLYGVDLAPVKMGAGPIGLSMDSVTNLGFPYAQYYLSWRDVEPQLDVIRWNWLDPIVISAALHNVKIVFRIYQTPPWATAAAGAHTPAKAIELARFVEALVRRYGNYVAAYVIWNEPNTPAGWENRPVDAAAYITMLSYAYHAAKTVNPNTVIISAGLAPTLGGGGAVNDIAYLGQMYAAGLRNVADVVGMNGFGFGDAPDDISDPDGMNFSRLAALRQVMVTNGASAQPACALEVGWLVDTGQSLPGFDGYKVSEIMQARYLKRAMEKANDEWPWLIALFIWNLDFGADSSEPEKEAFAIEGRPAYNCIRIVGAAQCPSTLYLPLNVRN